MNFLDQVRTLIDARLAELGIELPRADAPQEMRCFHLFAESCPEEEEVPREEMVSRRLMNRICRCQESSFTAGAHCIDINEPLPHALLRRLPENMQVPSVEPHPPDLNAVNLSFAARVVIAVRDKFAGDAPRVYTAAHISRQAYSQIISDETRPVSKRTAIRFAFALRSTPAEAQLLLKSAGYAFSNAQAEDVVLQVCLEVNPPIFDLALVNKLLQEYRVDYQY